MSPNKSSTNPLNSEIENEMQNINFNQFAHQMNAGSDEEDDRMPNDGYVLLNQDQEIGHELDDESESDYESTDEENAERRTDSNYCRWNVNIEWAECSDEKQSNDSAADRQSISHDKTEDEFANNDQFKSYLDNQLTVEELPFQREYDKRESNEESNRIDLNEENIDTIKECMKKIKLSCNSIPSWADADSSISERLTNFIYKRASK